MRILYVTTQNGEQQSERVFFLKYCIFHITIYLLNATFEICVFEYFLLKTSNEIYGTVKICQEVTLYKLSKVFKGRTIKLINKYNFAIKPILLAYLVRVEDSTKL